MGVSDQHLLVATEDKRIFSGRKTVSVLGRIGRGALTPSPPTDDLSTVCYFPAAAAAAAPQSPGKGRSSSVNHPTEVASCLLSSEDRSVG